MFDLTEQQLAELSGLVEDKLGLRFTRDRWQELHRGIKKACHQMGIRDARSCLELLANDSPDQSKIEVLASHLTIGETYFFRDPHLFAALENHIIPSLLRSRFAGHRQLRLWSAGCSTGEEPYSISILLHRMVPEIETWSITILATDINPRSLDIAAKARYPEWSFRGTAPSFKKLFFKPAGKNSFELNVEPRRLVTFSYLNLMDDAYPSLLTNTTAMDIILCRNVLMYFALEGQRRVIERFRRAVRPGGWLIVGPCEMNQTLYEGFETVSFENAFAYRKPVPEAHVPDAHVVVTPSQPEYQPLEFLETQRETPPLKDLPATVEPPREDQPAQLSSEARQLYENGDYEAALRLVDRQLNIKGTDLETLTLKSRILANQGRLDEALSEVEAALRAEKLDPRFHLLRGMILHEQGRADEAMAAFNRVLFLEPSSVIGHFALSNLERESGQLVLAARHAARAASLLDHYEPYDIVPESEGVTAGRLREILNRLQASSSAD